MKKGFLQRFEAFLFTRFPALVFKDCCALSIIVSPLLRLIVKIAYSNGRREDGFTQTVRLNPINR